MIGAAPEYHAYASLPTLFWCCNPKAEGVLQGSSKHFLLQAASLASAAGVLPELDNAVTSF